MVNKDEQNAPVLSLEYVLDDFGWADCRIGNGEQTAEFRVSYLSDPLYVLANVACGLLVNPVAGPLKEYSVEGGIHFGDEPGVRLLVFDLAFLGDGTSGADLETSIPFRLLYDPDAVGSTEVHGVMETVLEGTVTIGGFTRMVLNLLLGILNAHGFSGYRNRWLDSEFPLTQTARLAALLGESSLPVPLN